MPLLAEILRGTPRLTNAACVDSPGLFDARDRDELSEDADYRHRAALNMCMRCPAIDACSEWADTQRDQNSFVIAGRRPHNTPGRPPKETAA